jgi:hypothetical protein
MPRRREWLRSTEQEWWVSDSASGRLKRASRSPN